MSRTASNTASHGIMEWDIFFRTSSLPEFFNQGKQLHLYNFTALQQC